MSPQKLSRTTYRDPTDPAKPLRSGDASRAELALDMDDYYRPLEQIHGSGAHEFGVGQGMRLTATAGAAGVRVLAGIAVDVAGRHISLAVTGQAEVGPNADVPGTAPTLVAVDPVNGAPVPTAGMSGERLVVVRHWETFDDSAWTLFGAYRFVHTPWIRLVPAVGYVDTGEDVVLGKVTLDGAGNVTAMATGPRHALGVPVETVHLRRAAATGFSVEEKAYGEIHPRASGGIEITVPNPTDTIDLERQGGGAMAKLSVAADSITFRRNDGRETIRFNTALGHILAGGNGVDGDVRLFDHGGRLTIALDGHGAVGVFGADGQAGELRVKSGARGAPTMFEARGQSGDVVFQGRLRDFANSYQGVSHAELKDLTDGGETTLHRHNLGVLGHGPATGTQLGIASGYVLLGAPAGQNMYGDVTINFQDWTVTPGGSGFSSHWISGYQGVFTAAPHVIMSPSALSLSTYDDTWFSLSYNVSDTSVKFIWAIDTGGALNQQHFMFLIVGPI